MGLDSNGAELPRELADGVEPVAHDGGTPVPDVSRSEERSTGWRAYAAPASAVALLILAAAMQWFGLPGFSPARGGRLTGWDWLLLSGLATLAVGVLLAQSIPGRLDRMLRRLVGRDALPIGRDELATLEARLSARARAWGRGFGLIVGLALLLGFAVAGALPGKIELAVLEAGLGFVAGRYLGRMAAYGTLGRLLAHGRTRLRVQPGHIDGAAGLKPVGDFYFVQAMVSALPALFLASWWFLIPVWPYADYGAWRGPYLLLLPLAIAFEVLAFVAPMWSFHREMTRRKAGLLEKADALSRQVTAIQEELGASDDERRRGALKDRLASITQQYWDIEHLPTWPVDIGKWRQFGGSNLALATPLLTEYLGLERIGEKLLDWLRGVLQNSTA
jgi:hypothetical protein